MRHRPLFSTILMCVATLFPSALTAKITLSDAALYDLSLDLPDGDQIFQDWHAKGIDPDGKTPIAESCWVYTPSYLAVEINNRHAVPEVSRQPAELAPVITLLWWEFGALIDYDLGYKIRSLPLRIEIGGQDFSKSILPDTSIPLSHRTDRFLEVLSHLASGQQLVIYETFEITPPPRPSFGLGVTGENAITMPLKKEEFAFSDPNEGHDLTQLDWFKRSAPRPRFGQMQENGNTSLSTFTFPVSLDGFSEAYQQALTWCGWTDEPSLDSPD